MEHERNMTDIEQAIHTLKQAFEVDPDYARSWHDNLAMAFYDSVDMDKQAIDYCNDGASRFMKLLFDIETKRGA